MLLIIYFQSIVNLLRGQRILQKTSWRPTKWSKLPSNNSTKTKVPTSSSRMRCNYPHHNSIEPCLKIWDSTIWAWRIQIWVQDRATVQMTISITTNSLLHRMRVLHLQRWSDWRKNWLTCRTHFHASIQIPSSLGSISKESTWWRPW